MGCMESNMERARDVANYWSWLPAFRAVAETQHLPTAAKLLCVSPSAVSRTLRLLEEHLGEPLFDRSGGRLALNPRGSILLECVRHAMRTVHEGTEAMRGAQLTGSLRISASGALAQVFVIPALATLSAQLPRLIPELVGGGSGGLEEALRQGALDLALMENTPPDIALSSRVIARLEHDVFVAADSGFTRSDLTSLRFVVPVDDVGEVVPDAWPKAWKRTVVMRTASARTAIDAVRGGVDAVVLPIAVGVSSGLRPLRVRGLETTDLVLLHREPIGVMPTAAEMVADVLATSIRTRLEKLPGVHATDETSVAEQPSGEIAI